MKADDGTVRDKLLQLLLPTLHQNGRLINRRYTILESRALSRTSPDRLNQLYESSDGGTVVVNLQETDVDGLDESDLAPKETDELIVLCGCMKKYRNQVLTVFCMPCADGKRERLILEHIGAITIVNLHEDLVCGERAKQYLKRLAGQHGVPGAKSLYAAAADREKGFLPSDLNRIFSLWFDRQLKTDIFPQYADLAPACTVTAKKKAVGSAYLELDEMIGLEGAKTVIR